MKSDTVIKGPLLLVSSHAVHTLTPGANSFALGRIGAAIKTLRKCRGLSLAKLAQESGIPSSTINDVEEGRSDMRVSALMAIERGLNVPPGYILRTTR
jgi:DNA-binding XRE family transcriptional regulator